MKRYEALYQKKYGQKPPKGTYEQGPNTVQGPGKTNTNVQQTQAPTTNTVGGNTNTMDLNNSQNNNSGVITNDFSDNRMTFQEGSNTYNFNGSEPDWALI